MGMKSNDGTVSYMKRGTTEAPMEPQQHPKKAKKVKVPTGTKSLWSNPQCAALGALLQAPFSHGPFRVATPAPRLRTTLQLRRTSNAVHTGNTPAKHVRYCVLGQNKRREVQPNGVLFSFKLEAAADVPLQKRQQKSPTFSHLEARFHGETAMLATNRCHCTT